MDTKISHTKKVQLMTPEFVESRRQYLHDERQSNPNDINGMMDPHYVSVDYYEGTMTLRFETKLWEMNRVGILHGGVISTMLDHTAGSAVYTFLGHWCPTVDIDVRYISQAVMGDVLICTGRVIHCGERIITAEATMINERTGRLVATSLMTCANGADRAKGALDKGDRHEGALDKGDRHEGAAE